MVRRKLDKLIKVKRLAERGIAGEKEQAQLTYKRLLEKYRKDPEIIRIISSAKNTKNIKQEKETKIKFNMNSKSSIEDFVDFIKNNR